MTSLPVGPKGSLLAGCQDELKRDPLGFMTRMKEEFGNVVSFRVGFSPILLINEPDLIQQVLVTDATKFTKDVALKNNREFFGNGLLSSEGSYWKRQRKLASPAFSPKRLEEYAQIMVDHGYRMLQCWHDGKTIDAQHEMMELTLGIAAKTLFDAEIDKNHELEEALTAAQKHLSDRMNDVFILMLPEWVPFPTNVHLLEAIKTVDKVIYNLIEERRGKTEGRRDLLSILMSVTDEEDGTGMTDQQLRDEIFTLFFAGHETTALTLTWTLWLIAQHPEVEQHLLAELKSVLGGRKPTAADYTSLPYTEKVIKESMRIRPPVWAIGREAAEDCTIGEFDVGKGTAILISQWLMHHDKRYYQDSEQFRPARWTTGFVQDLPKFAYFPFGGGPRVCIGNGFAMLEGVLLLAAIMQEYQFISVPEHPVDLLPAVTLRPAHGIKLSLKKRIHAQVQ